jgi:hypothetical protein
VFVPNGKQRKKLPMLVVRVPVGSALKVISDDGTRCVDLEGADETDARLPRPPGAAPQAGYRRPGPAPAPPGPGGQAGSGPPPALGGRFILGVGTGWRVAEFALLGADFANRAAATDEAM